MAKAKPIAGLDPSEPILSCACLIIETRLGEMLNYEPFIDNVKRVVELHQMRIAAKRLRYTMEIFQPLYTAYTQHGTAFVKATEQIKALQEHLGQIHDADVLVPRLESHLARLLKPGCGKDKSGDPRVGVNLVDIDGCQGLLTLCKQVRNERASAYRRLTSEWARHREKRSFEELIEMLRESAAPVAVHVPAEAAQ